MDSEVLLPHCHYRLLDNGIHEFVFLTNTRLAVDDYFTLLETSRMAQGERVEGVVCLIIELRQEGMPPISYMVQRYRDFIKQHKDHMPNTRVVYLYRSGFMPSLVRSFIGLIAERKTGNRRFYSVAERSQAEAWLLEVKS